MAWLNEVQGGTPPTYAETYLLSPRALGSARRGEYMTAEGRSKGALLGVTNRRVATC